MKGNIIDIYYFSGTGNTLLVVNEVAKTLQQHGKEVNLYKITNSDPATINLRHVIGLAFPVAVFSTYPFVWDFINKLPHTNDTEIFMLDSLAGFSGGIVGPLKKVLQKKGYHPIGANEFIMPGNYGKAIPSPTKIREKIAKMRTKAAKFAKLLITGKTHWYRVPWVSDLVRLLSRSNKPWQSMSKNITIDKNLCNKCGICARICPTQCIKMQGFPVKQNGCVACMHCVAFCPQNAILYKEKQVRYLAPNIEEIL